MYSAPLILTGLFAVFTINGEFKTDQLKFPKVKEAYAQKETVIKKILLEKDLQISSLQIFIRIFKEEQRLEVWAKDKTSSEYMFLKEYEICASSGLPGPKRKGGDMQVPEGYYYINHFNPQSNFYLSLGINYPNQSDVILGDKGNLGGAIYIHGSCVTIGCIPITDDCIKELYILCVEAKNGGQKQIPVHIFPCRLSKPKLKEMKLSYATQPGLFRFWSNLAEGYNYFEEKHIIPTIIIKPDGRYFLK